MLFRSTVLEWVAQSKLPHKAKRRDERAIVSQERSFPRWAMPWHSRVRLTFFAPDDSLPIQPSTNGNTNSVQQESGQHPGETFQASVSDVQGCRKSKKAVAIVRSRNPSRHVMSAGADLKSSTNFVSQSNHTTNGHQHGYNPN